MQVIGMRGCTGAGPDNRQVGQVQGRVWMLEQACGVSCVRAGFILQSIV